MALMSVDPIPGRVVDRPVARTAEDEAVARLVGRREPSDHGPGVVRPERRGRDGTGHGQDRVVAEGVDEAFGELARRRQHPRHLAEVVD
jgi:hypothetical protein